MIEMRRRSAQEQAAFWDGVVAALTVCRSSRVPDLETAMWQLEFIVSVARQAGFCDPEQGEPGGEP